MTRCLGATVLFSLMVFRPYALHTPTVFLGTVDKHEGFFYPFFCTDQFGFARMLMYFFSRFSSFHNISAKVKTLTQLLQNIDFIPFKATQEVQLH